MRMQRGSIGLKTENIRRVIRVLIAININRMLNINRKNMMSSQNRKEILVGKRDPVVAGKCKEMRTWMISILMKKVKEKISNKEGNHILPRTLVVENGKNHLGKMRGQDWMKTYQEQ